MGLKEDLLRGIYSYGFEKPSAIQQRAIKPLIMMRDTIAQAQSGTGKTATFTIGPCPPTLAWRARTRVHAVPLENPAPLSEPRGDQLVAVIAAALATNIASAILTVELTMVSIVHRPAAKHRPL